MHHVRYFRKGLFQHCGHGPRQTVLFFYSCHNEYLGRILTEGLFKINFFTCILILLCTQVHNKHQLELSGNKLEF